MSTKLSCTSGLEAKYGLPAEVKFCARCVMSNQKPDSAVEYKHTSGSKKSTVVFSEDNICAGCRAVEQIKGKVNWEEREKQLWALCDKFRKTNGEYDCLVPGSGGKDSFYQAHILKYKYKMNPLTVTWAPHLYTDWGLRNHHAWINAGFDNYLCTPNGRVHRLLTRLAVDNLFHPFQPFMFGQKILAPKMAARFNIPLIFYGENSAEYGNPINDLNTALQHKEFFSTSNRDDMFFGGVSVKDLIGEYGVLLNELEPYLPLSSDIIEKNKIQVHYLGHYLKWHPQACYYYAVEHGGFEASPERTPGTYSKYNSIDDKIDDLHYWTTFVKFGIGRATYDAAQEIRSGDITREEGVALIKRFDGEWPDRFENELMEYLSINKKEFPKAYEKFETPIMTKDYFFSLADRFRSPHLWEKENGKWNLRHAIWHPSHSL
jgi:N-acetyl sugar amidotransferase